MLHRGPPPSAPRGSACERGPSRRCSRCRSSSVSTSSARFGTATETGCRPRLSTCARNRAALSRPVESGAKASGAERLNAFVVPSSASTSATPPGGRRRQERAQVVGHDAGQVGVDDRGSARPESPTSAACDRRPLAAARVVDERRHRPRARARRLRRPTSRRAASPTAKAAASTSPSIASESSRRSRRDACSRVLPSTPANGMTTVVTGRD